MSDDEDILGLFETEQTPNEPIPSRESHPVRFSKGIGTFLLSAGFTIVVGLVIGALQIAGVTSMSLAHLLIALAWVIAVFAIWLWLLSRPRKHTMKVVIITTLILGVVFFGVDRFMVWKKAEQEREAQEQQHTATPIDAATQFPKSTSPTIAAQTSPSPMPAPSSTPSPLPAAPKPRSRRSNAEAERLRQQKLLKDLGYPNP